MNRLIKFVAPAIAASLALGAAMPASAAPGYGYNAHNRIKQDIAQLDRDVDRAERRQLLTRSEARNLDLKVDRIERLYETFSRNGFTNGEMKVLQARIDTAEREVARKIGDRNLHGKDRGKSWHDDHRDTRRDDHRNYRPR